MPKKILLADDSVTIQKVVELTFAEGDYEVTCVSNGRAAVDRLKTIRPDILLCDIIMPELSGYEVAEFVKRDPVFKGIPVILLTGTFEPFDEEKARLSGADTYITKPFDSRMLVEKVESLLAKRLVMDAAPYTQVMELLPGQGQSMTVLPPPPPTEALQAMLDRPPEAPAASFPGTHVSPNPEPPQVVAPVPSPGFLAPLASPPAGVASVETSLPEMTPVTPAGTFAFGSADASPFEQVAPPVVPPVPVASAPPVPEAPVAAPPTPAVMDLGDFKISPPEDPGWNAEDFAGPATSAPADSIPAAIPESPVLVEPESSAFSPLNEVPPVAAGEVAFAGAEPVFSGGMDAEVSSAQAFEKDAIGEKDHQEPELPPFEGHEADVGPEMPPPAPPFMEQEGPEPELERAVWDRDEGAAEAISPVEGLVQDMTAQQEMVAEAQAFEEPPMASEEPSADEDAFAGAAPESESAWSEEALGSEVAPVPPVSAPGFDAPAPGAAAIPTVELAQIEEIVRKVIAEMAPDLVRQVAWEVIPELAEGLIKRRIQELESQVE